jgi:phage tail sheath protein FI
LESTPNSKDVFFREEMLITKAIRAYFTNGGKSLYILPQPRERYILLDIEKYRIFLEEQIDSMLYIESIVAVDIFTTEWLLLDNKQIQKLQNSISKYCKETNRLSLMDLPKETNKPIEYSEMLYYTMTFYPWLIDRDKNTLPPSIYASAILSSLGSQQKVFHSIANITLRDVVNTQSSVDKEYASALYDSDINPILYIQNYGFKIWGIRTLGDDIRDINRLRVLFFIKRMLYLLAKEYIFEPNNSVITNKISRKIRAFLMNLWRDGTLKGSSTDEAFLVSVEENFSEKIVFNISVAISKPLEYIIIQLNKTTNSDLQSRLNIF